MTPDGTFLDGRKHENSHVVGQRHTGGIAGGLHNRSGADARRADDHQRLETRPDQRNDHLDV